jgi:hypothetical protein
MVKIAKKKLFKKGQHTERGYIRMKIRRVL